ncbi:MAG: hypothetical protein QNJ46_09380 [Leptolyngbyaceae cyanobacterium MO_188.B28]|nr:hypothetical protein [Leptolyngbyaceae cyanobacterium MO_188.B28]
MGLTLGCAQTNAPKKNLSKPTETTSPAIDPVQISRQKAPQPETDITASSTSALIPGEQVWTELLPGEEAYELEFTAEGALLYQGTVLVSDIQVSSDVYAKKLIISPSSPSGNYHFLKACDGLDESALCWTEFLVNKAEGGAQQVGLTKYGVMHWVQWSEDEQYALFSYTGEGAFTFYALNLETGEPSSDADWFCDVDLSSFSWVDNRLFQVQVFDNDDTDWQCNDSPSVFVGDISELFG